eukprot:933326_1
MPKRVKARRGFGKKKTNSNSNDMSTSHMMDLDSVSESVEEEKQGELPSLSHPHTNTTSIEVLTASITSLTHKTSTKTSIDYLKDYPNNSKRDRANLTSKLVRITKQLQSSKPSPIQYSHLLGSAASKAILTHKYNGIKLIRDGATVAEIKEHVDAFESRFDREFRPRLLNTKQDPTAIKLPKRLIKKKVQLSGRSTAVSVSKITVGSFVYTCNGLAVVMYTKRTRSRDTNGIESRVRHIEAKVLDGSESIIRFSLDDPLDVQFACGDVVEYARKRYVIKDIRDDGAIQLVTELSDNGCTAHGASRLKLVAMDRSWIEASE